MSYYEDVVWEYLRADRALFINTEYLIQIHPGNAPAKNLHWYCDAVVLDHRDKVVFLCEISYAKGLSSLHNRLKSWHICWDEVCKALRRDSFLEEFWAVHPWLFVPEEFIPDLERRLKQFNEGSEVKFIPKFTPLQAVQPWKYRSWNRYEVEPKDA